MVSFDSLPRFARWAIVWEFALRLALIYAATLVWAEVLVQSNVPGALVPVLAIASFASAPIVAWRDLARSQLGPFHLRVVQTPDCAPAAAIEWRQSPTRLRRAVEFGISWRAALVTNFLLLVLLTSLSFTSELLNGPTWRSFVGYALVALPLIGSAAVAFYWAVYRTVRTEKDGFTLRLVG